MSQLTLSNIPLRSVNDRRSVCLSYLEEIAIFGYELNLKFNEITTGNENHNTYRMS